MIPHNHPIWAKVQARQYLTILRNVQRGMLVREPRDLVTGVYACDDYDILARVIEVGT